LVERTTLNRVVEGSIPSFGALSLIVKWLSLLTLNQASGVRIAVRELFAPLRALPQDNFLPRRELGSAILSAACEECKFLKERKMVSKESFESKRDVFQSCETQIVERGRYQHNIELDENEEEESYNNE
jgi:hypothetical protein